MTEPRIVEQTQMGHATIKVDGVLRTVDLPLKIIETYHEDGRKDCTVQVPRIETKLGLQEK